VWHVEAERLGGLEVNDEIEFRRLLNRYIGWLFPRKILSTNSAARLNRSGKLAPYDSRLRRPPPPGDRK
jgi:hypothetical protein